nr:hypothetical protein [Tanacetum cinerariifolium]
MHKAFPLLGESSYWQYKFPLPVEGVPTARRMEIPLRKLRQHQHRHLQPHKLKLHMYLNLFHTRSLKQRLSLLGKKVEAIPKSAWTEKDQIDNFLKEIRCKVVRHRYSNPMIQPELEGSTQGYALVSVEVLRYDKRSKSKNIGIVPTEMELILEHTQQGISHEVLSQVLLISMCAYKVLLILTCQNQQGGRSRCIPDSVHSVLLSLQESFESTQERIVGLGQRLSLLGKKVKAIPKSAWIEKDQIDNFLKERRLMRSLEKFVGGRLYEGDLRLLQRTI